MSCSGVFEDVSAAGNFLPSARSHQQDDAMMSFVWRWRFCNFFRFLFFPSMRSKHVSQCHISQQTQVSTQRFSQRCGHSSAALKIREREKRRESYLVGKFAQGLQISRKVSQNPKSWVWRYNSQAGQAEQQQLAVLVATAVFINLTGRQSDKTNKPKGRRQKSEAAGEHQN